ncbi:TRAP transporter small permease [Phaeobacter sp. HF9A]|uniref:TRAP transporter small permease n=1 Tax=Phaeobacter sp. HF9A TaxID=2721561 RepID=UPI00142F8799|nr:TRAP transporter small permease [Phaeobacter sp. HF9A]NIZ12281.1 TRAP transporter small permease [Phaeobacter sp. HF9A]
MEQDDRPDTSGAVAKAVLAWALLGGLLLLAVVMMNVASVLGTLVGWPVPGDFELTEMGVAIAAFAFLPYCQLSRSNVTADIFTQGAGPRLRAFLGALGSLIALLFALLMLWRMFDGLLDQKNYGYETSILQIPVWLAYLPVLASLALLAVAALATLTQDIRRLSNGGPHD